jgi:OFA family oxalate/formate antiporter-like MFS transporter
MLYTAKGTAALLVPLASLLASGYGWHAVFVIALTFNISAALLAAFALKPLRARFLAGTRSAALPFSQPELTPGQGDHAHAARRNGA